MRRLLRRLFTLVSAVSLLLCVAVCVLWAWSQWHAHEITWAARGTRYGLESTPGGWTFYADQLMPAAAGVQVPALDLAQPDLPTVRVVGPPVRRFAVPGLEFEQGFVDGGTLLVGGRVLPPSGDTYAEARVRWWVTALLTGCLPLAELSRRATAHRDLPPGFCAACGYDLRATSERCPECGTAVGK